MEAGSRVFVHYDIPGDPTWHERLPCGCVDGTEWVVVTPDLDSFVEDLDPVSNHDITGVRGIWDAPPDNPQHLYTFTNLTPATSMRLVSEGDLKAMRERRRRGLPDLHRGMVQHGARPPPAPPNPGPHAGFGFQGGYPLPAPGAPAPMGDGDPNAERIPIAGAAVGGGLGAL